MALSMRPGSGNNSVKAGGKGKVMVAAVIYETGSLQAIGACDGPEPDGHCPRALSDGRVFCAGHDIEVMRDETEAGCGGLKRERIAVSQQSICPLVRARIVCGREYFSPFLPLGNRL
jgi:hypothetical protein